MVTQTSSERFTKSILKNKKKIQLNAEQNFALELLQGESNLFLTGAAGTGKSTLLGEYLRGRDPKENPILASTGAAAILVGGRTFHSFFGLGILEGGVGATIDRALRNPRLIKRIRETKAVIIDEVSMLSGSTLFAAEQIARTVRQTDLPWGGLRVIAVGDFSQLPPVTLSGQTKDWAFLHDVWFQSDFSPIYLRKNMRTSESFLVRVLNQIRQGEIDANVEEFLEARTVPPPLNFKGTRLFARREDVEKLNRERLSELSGPELEYKTEYVGKKEALETFKKNAPVPEILVLKEGALVMFRQNDPEQRWVNGTLGTLTEATEKRLQVQLLNKKLVEVRKVDFTLLDAEGELIAKASNFPIQLAWAITIHKAQGSTIDELTVDLRRLWEPGHAYVALSRARSADTLYIEGWHPSSFKTDPLVRELERRLQADFPDPEKSFS